MKKTVCYIFFLLCFAVIPPMYSQAKATKNNTYKIKKGKKITLTYKKNNEKWKAQKTHQTAGTSEVVSISKKAQSVVVKGAGIGSANFYVTWKNKKGTTKKIEYKFIVKKK